MKPSIKYLAICLSSIFSLFSCESFLDKQPLTEVAETDVWSDPALINAFVNSRYNQIGVGWTESWQSSVVDETYLTWSRGCEPITQGYVSPSELGRMNGAWWGWDNRAWETVWANIANCNLFFSRIDEAPFSDENQKQQLIGQVRFIRALMYHDLISRWGAVPLITSAYTLNDVEIIMQQTRATYKECVDFMISELDQAVTELPTSFSGVDKGRATSIAALALKSRILLYAASDLMNIDVKSEYVGYTTPDPDRWPKVVDAAKRCIETAEENGYFLYDKYGDDVKTKYTQLFLEGGNSEIIFDRQGTTSADGESINTIDQTNGPNGYGCWGGNTPIQEFVDAFEMENGDTFNWNNTEHSKNPFDNRDKRLYAMVLCDGDFWKERQVECYIDADANGNELTSGGRDSKYGPDAWNTSLTGYNMRKFMDESYVPNSWNVKTPKNWIWLRLGEQYLNLAEAYYMMGNEPEARKALNVIRRRARMPEITVSGNLLLEKIKNERRIELAFEEHRYFDVRRWREGDKYFNKTVTGITVLALPDGTKRYKPGKVVEERKFFEHMNWLPIPKDEIDKNPKIIQNPGYTN